MAFEVAVIVGYVQGLVAGGGSECVPCYACERPIVLSNLGTAPSADEGEDPAAGPVEDPIGWPREGRSIHVVSELAIGDVDTYGFAICHVCGADDAVLRAQLLRRSDDLRLVAQDLENLARMPYVRIEMERMTASGP
jgi:hypothetical protein